VFKPAEMPAVLTYAGDRGEFADTNKVEAVPEEAKGFVRVALLAQGDPPPPGHVWVAHLGKPQAEGEYALTPVPRDLFEELALGQGRSSRIVLPGDLEPPRQLGTSGGLIVYKTAWCGVCKQLESYLERKGVEYVAKDIEHDREAAAELRAKAQAKGMNAQSVPVIDVNGELIVGFDRARLEKLL
jgi:glutaredoxin